MTVDQIQMIGEIIGWLLLLFGSVKVRSYLKIIAVLINSIESVSKQNPVMGNLTKSLIKAQAQDSLIEGALNKHVKKHTT